MSIDILATMAGAFLFRGAYSAYNVVTKKSDGPLSISEVYLSRANLSIEKVVAKRYQEPHDFVVNEIDGYLAKEVRKLYDEQNYNHAVADAIQYFVEEVQKKAKIRDESKYGVNLMSHAFGIEGVLRTQKRLITITDKDFNEGIKFTAMGLITRHRNPIIHKSTSRHPYTRLECLNVLTTVNMLLRDLEKCKYFKKK